MFRKEIEDDHTLNRSVLDIGNSFPFRLSPKIQQMIEVTRRAHLQSLCYPFHRQRRLRSQPRCHGHLPRVTFGSTSQLLPPHRRRFISSNTISSACASTVSCRSAPYCSAP